ncbi:MAG TPA: site-specific integrase, partial [Chloroflexia bacterium]|nr:site-specific integrase [Chloroflexia bacterium]
MSEHILTSNHPAPDTLQYYIDAFLLKHRAERHSLKTLKYYETNLSRFQWFLAQHGYSTQLADITPTHIRAFLLYAQEAEAGRWGTDAGRHADKLSPFSVHAFARCLRAFWRWASDEADLSRNPFSNVAMPKIPNQWKVEAFTDAEIKELFRAIERMESPFMVA